MIGLFWNVMLAVCWIFLTGNFEVLNYLFGFFIGYLVVALIHNLVPSLQGYPQRLPRFFAFLGYFIRELVKANIKVAIDIVTPPWHMKPGVISFTVSDLNDLEITVLANQAALEPFRTSTPEREKELLPYLQEPGPMLYDIDLEVGLAPEGKAETVIARTNSLRGALFEIEKTLDPIDAIFMYQVIELTGEVADMAERVGRRLELLLSH